MSGAEDVSIIRGKKNSDGSFTFVNTSNRANVFGGLSSQLENVDEEYKKEWQKQDEKEGNTIFGRNVTEARRMIESRDDEKQLESDEPRFYFPGAVQNPPKFVLVLGMEECNRGSEIKLRVARYKTVENPPVYFYGGVNLEKIRPVHQRTLVFLKPDAFKKEVTEHVIQILESHNLKIEKYQVVETPPSSLIREHYKEHAQKSFFEANCVFVEGGPLLVLVLSGINAIECTRTLQGNYEDSNCIRGFFGAGKTENIIHSSDSPESAQDEIALWESYERNNWQSFNKMPSFGTNSEEF